MHPTPTDASAYQFTADGFATQSGLGYFTAQDEPRLGRNRMRSGATLLRLFDTRGKLSTRDNIMIQ